MARRASAMLPVIGDPERLAALLERMPYMPHLEAARALVG